MTNDQILFGQNIKQSTITGDLLTGPGDDLVLKTIATMAAIPGFTAIFGPWTAPTGKPSDDSQRWADYQRADWSLRQLPAINVFEAQNEDKTSDEAWLNGTVSFQVFWPAAFRRSDMRRVEVEFKAAIDNFFSSQYAAQMLDELYYIQRPNKVYGLNEYGKTKTWTPNTQGVVEDELVPVTIIDVRYRIDLRAWYRALEFMSRTKDDPFDVTLGPLTEIYGQYDGVDDNGNTQVVVDDNIPVSSP